MFLVYWSGHYLFSWLVTSPLDIIFQKLFPCYAFDVKGDNNKYILHELSIPVLLRSSFNFLVGFKKRKTVIRMISTIRVMLIKNLFI